MQLPPLQVTRAVVQRYCRLLHRYGDDLGFRPLVLPNAQFFPDAFLGDLDSVQTLVARMSAHAGLNDIPVTVELVGADGPQSNGSSCSSQNCGVPQTSAGMDRLVDLGESWLLRVSTAELRHPIALTTNVARSLAFVFMVETQREGELLEPPVDVTADLIAVALGFGPLMLQGSYIYAKSCGGPQIASVTKVSVSELAVVTSLFALLGDHPLTSALRELDITQRTLLSETHELLRANPALIARIRRTPREVSTFDFELSPARSFMSRLFLNRPKKARAISGIRIDAITADMDLDEVESLLIDMPPSSRAGRTLSPVRLDPKMDELKALVSESLNEVSL